MVGLATSWFLNTNAEVHQMVLLDLIVAACLQPVMLDKLADLEKALGYDLYYTSACRSLDHPLEARKASPGTHARKIAVDIRCRTNCLRIAQEASKLGFDGIGTYDKHIHLDIRGYPARWTGQSQ